MKSRCEMIITDRVKSRGLGKVVRVRCKNKVVKRFWVLRPYSSFLHQLCQTHSEVIENATLYFDWKLESFKENK